MSCSNDRFSEDRSRDSAPRAGEPQTPAKRGFRPDIEGLRAIAVGAVLLYHAGLPFVGGGYIGVDVFFVISGFLITGLIVGEIERTGGLSLLRFYSRRAKRLLPLTLVVLGFVFVLSIAVLSPVRQDDVSRDIAASGLYVINWRLADQAVDYFAAGLNTSPVQHFWSLAVEEQFYLVWPALALGVATLSRRFGARLTPALVWVMSVLAVVSFVYGLFLTRGEASAAYFSTLTRAWELAAGGLLAVAPFHRLRVPGWAASLVALGGVGAIVLAAVTLSDDTPFPGVAALLPALGTVAVIASGSLGGATLVSRFLTLGPVRHVGRISYSWYLWHWPILVFAGAVWERLSTLESLGLVAASWVPAVVSHHLVEKPFKEWRALVRFPARGLWVGGACAAASIAMGFVLFSVTPSVDRAPENDADGAEAVLRGDDLQKVAFKMRPTPREADDDRSKMHADGCLLERRATKSPPCVYGDPDSGKTVVIFGDSHSMQYFPALRKIAEERDWRLVGLTKGACTPADVTTFEQSLGREYRECPEWRENTLKRIINKEKPDMVFVSSLTNYTVMEDGGKLGGKEGHEALKKGYVRTLERLRKHDVPVTVFKDVPYPDKDVPDCISRNMDDLDECAFPRKKALDYDPVNREAANAVDGVTLIDPTPVICPDEECPAVIGNVVVYRNGSHITATYARTLSRWLDKEIPRVG